MGREEEFRTWYGIGETAAKSWHNSRQNRQKKYRMAGTFRSGAMIVAIPIPTQLSIDSMSAFGTKSPLFVVLTGLLLGLPGLCPVAWGQGAAAYWGDHTPLKTFRPAVPASRDMTYEDLDGDGDPDLMRYTLGGVAVVWIDDDDDMQRGDLEGDLDSDCLLTDVNGDGIFGGPHDVIIDWNDENNDQVADMQVIIQQTPNSEAETGPDEPGGAYLWQIDYDQDGTFHPIDWRSLLRGTWTEADMNTYFANCGGAMTMTRSRVATYNLRYLGYNYVNPFHSYDPDQDGLAEYAITLTEADQAPDYEYELDDTFDSTSHEPNFSFTGQVTGAVLAFDADNDNDPERPNDLDFALQLRGSGFLYDQKEQQRFKSMRGLAGTDSLFYDPRFRQREHLTFARRHKAQRMVFDEGDWDQAFFVFDEDDDCRRWDRVELIPPMRPFAGAEGHADLRGDRAEWDQDCSGGGKLYLSPLDGRLHLFGAETGLWQVDQQGRHYQNRNRPWEGDPEANQMVTFLYQDTDSNGYIDEIRIDLDGDRLFDELLSARALGINDVGTLIDPSRWTYEEVQALYRSMATDMWQQAELALQAAEAYGLNPQWYAFYRTPKSLRQQYDYGYWLCFYIYHDLAHLMRNDLDRQNDLYEVRRAYLSTNWGRE